MCPVTKPEADSNDRQASKHFGLRPSRGETQTNTGDVSPFLIVEKRGYGLVALGSSAIMGNITFKVGHKADLSDGFVIADLTADMTAANASFDTERLATYPYFQPISDATPTGDLLISLT